MTAKSLLEDLKKLKPASPNETTLIRAVSYLLEREGTAKAATAKPSAPRRNAMEDRD
jgi:hypothetical protein